MSSYKRTSSDYDFTPQLKRLSFDEAKEFKQSIYDKTINLLYEGAKCNSKLEAPLRSPVKGISKSDRKQLKQVLLDNNGRLDSTQALYSVKEYHPSPTEKCSFCERLSCFTPLYQCNKCDDYFCGNCSLSTYSVSEDVPLCLSCFNVKVEVDVNYRRYNSQTNSLFWFCPNEYNRKYSLRKDLIRHLKYEYGVPKQFKCNLCDFITARSDNLRKHLLVRHKKPLQ